MQTSFLDLRRAVGFLSFLKFSLVLNSLKEQHPIEKNLVIVQLVTITLTILYSAQQRPVYSFTCFAKSDFHLSGGHSRAPRPVFSHSLVCSEQKRLQGLDKYTLGRWKFKASPKGSEAQRLSKRPPGQELTAVQSL